jgi:hypothetical protein
MSGFGTRHISYAPENTKRSIAGCPVSDWVRPVSSFQLWAARNRPAVERAGRWLRHRRARQDNATYLREQSSL